MSVAALYDIHGNLPALEAVLAEIRQLDVSELVIGGDVLPGPMQTETLACLLDLDLPTKFIRGNGELAVLAAKAGRPPASVPERHRAPIRWAAEQLTAEEKRLLATWPRTVLIDTPGLGAVLFCHATPRDENEIPGRASAADLCRDSGRSHCLRPHPHAV